MYMWREDMKKCSVLDMEGKRQLGKTIHIQGFGLGIRTGGLQENMTAQETTSQPVVHFSVCTIT